MTSILIARFTDYTAGAHASDLVTAEASRLATGVVANARGVRVETGGNLKVGYPHPAGGLVTDTFPVESGETVTGDFAVIYGVDSGGVGLGTTAQGLRIIW